MFVQRTPFFVLQLYLCLSTITEVPCVDTVARIRPVQTCGTGATKPTEYQNLFLLLDWIPFLCQKAVVWITVITAGSKCSLLLGTLITGVTEGVGGGGTDGLSLLLTGR